MLIGYAYELARAVFRSRPMPSEQRRERRTRSHLDGAGRCGLCPACGAFAFIELADEPGAVATCPSCFQEIDHLHPPDGR